MKNKSARTAIDARKKGYKQGYEKGIQDTVRDYSAVVMLVLKDKFDFDVKELMLVTQHINEMFDSVCCGYVSLEDIAKTLEEENALELRFQGQNPQLNMQPFELSQTSAINMPEEYREKYLGEFGGDMMDAQGRQIFINIGDQHGNCKEDLERHLKRAGYLD